MATYKFGRYKDWKGYEYFAIRRKSFFGWKIVKTWRLGKSSFDDFTKDDDIILNALLLKYNHKSTQELSDYKWYRKWKGGIWYQHQFTTRACVAFSFTGIFWTRYGKINDYSDVLIIESY